MRPRSYLLTDMNVEHGELTDQNTTLENHPAQIGLRFGWLIFLALGVQVVALGLVNDVSFDAARIMLVASYVVLVPAVVVNVKRPGIGLVLVGVILNFAVIAANGGSMPIDPQAFGVSVEDNEAMTASEGFLPFSKDTAQSGDEVNLRVLSDTFAVPGPLTIAFSIGDVFIALGILVFVLKPLLPRRRTAPA